MSEELLASSSSIEITPARKKGKTNYFKLKVENIENRNSARLRSDTATIPDLRATTTNLITAESFTKIFGNALL